MNPGERVMDKRPALGKGLSALIPDVPAPSAARNPQELDVDRLEPSEFQPRLHMDEAALDELARSRPTDVANALAATGLALGVGAEPAGVLDAARGILRAFGGLDHRMQLVAEHDGVRWVDDSKATNVHATIAAVEVPAPAAVTPVAVARAARVILT